MAITRRIRFSSMPTGEALLTACVYRDYHGSAFHYRWAHETKAQNGVLVDGQGQVPHSALLAGRIQDFEFTPTLDYVVGSAAEAYGGRLQRYRRSIAFVKPGFIVLCDDLVATNEATFQFMLHGLKAFRIDEASSRLQIDQPKAGALVQYLSPVPISFRQWDGYEPKPQREFPNQWHVQAGTMAKRRELQMLTVISPYRSGQETAWSATRLESATAVGVRIEAGDKTVCVGFRKGDSASARLLEDWVLEKPVAARGDSALSRSRWRFYFCKSCTNVPSWATRMLGFLPASLNSTS